MSAGLRDGRLCNGDFGRLRVAFDGYLCKCKWHYNYEMMMSFVFLE